MQKIVFNEVFLKDKLLDKILLYPLEYSDNIHSKIFNYMNRRDSKLVDF
jgi:hypothetical protein